MYGTISRGYIMGIILLLIVFFAVSYGAAWASVGFWSWIFSASGTGAVGTGTGAAGFLVPIWQWKIFGVAWIYFLGIMTYLYFK